MKPVRFFNRKILIIAKIEKVLRFIDYEIPMRVFHQILFRKEVRLNDFSTINYDGLKPKLYRLSESFARTLTSPLRIYLRGKSKSIHAKQWAYWDNYDEK